MSLDVVTAQSDDKPDDRAARYDGLTITLHWVIAVLIAVNLLLALALENLDDAARGSLIRVHKSVGVCILVLATLRLLWRFAKRPPPFLPSLGPAVRRLAKAVHWALLILPPVLALSGWAMISADKGGRVTLIFGVIKWPRIALFVHLPPFLREQVHVVLGAIHLGLALALTALIAVHVAGALIHQFIDREPEVERMAPKLFKRSGRPSAS